ncbi:MAG TPA: FAD-dependent oxidoreductase [Streptosporangiaceae bacterium]|nr:FAD-dependent oxidoreductase [Streptosporangiaceae bacterium]
MPSVRNVLIVGSGAAGCAAAILFARDGAAVDLIEIKPDLSALGSGITVQGNALRVLRQLGVWNEVAAAGYAFNTVGLRTPDGTLLVEMEDVRTGGPDLPATVGMYRPALARILTEAAAAAGAKLRYGTTVESLTHDADGVDVTFSDGTSSRYDLVIGADGVRSQIRSLLGIKLESKPTGMGIWRVFTSRPESVTRTDLYYRGACYIAGYCPTADDSLYAYIVEDAQDRSGLTPAEQLATMKQLSEAYHGPWDEIRETLTDPSRVNYTWFETHVLDVPWNRGRVVLIGDAAHTCPPTIAQGGAMALEDAVVLAELLTERATLDQGLWDAFTARRYERARTVVDASNQLAQWQLEHVRGDIPGLMRSIAMLTSQPA